MKKYKIINRLIISIIIILLFIKASDYIFYTCYTNNQPQKITVFNNKSNIWKSKYFRIPSLQILSDDTILAFSDIRYNGASDHGFIDIGCARSTDHGNTWEYKIAMRNDRTSKNFSRVMDSTTVVTNTGRIILIAGSWNKDGNWSNSNTSLRDDWSVQMVYSDDNGKTWSHKINLTKNIGRIRNQPPNTIGWLGGVGTGIVMSNGTIVLPIQIALRENDSNNYYSSIIYSNDNGDTWTMGNKVPDSKTSENMVIELDGNLIMSCRSDSFESRGSYISNDLGQSWEIYEPLHKKISTGSGSGCQGSFIKITNKSGDRIGLISAPQNNFGGYIRDNITVYMINFDDLSKGICKLCVPYPYKGNIKGGGYSCLSFNDYTLGILYEANGSIEYQDLTSYLIDIINLDTKNFDYLSDIDWEKSTSSRGQVQRDTAHDGINNLTLKSDTINFCKGVCIHSNGQLVVNLNGKDYKTFETHVGILQNLTKSNNSGSIIFKFFLDDNLVKSTDIMYPDTPEEFISFDVYNSSTLKIVVESPDSNIDGDWGVLGDAKFIKNDQSTVYLSDIEWKKSISSHGQITRDIAHDGISKLILKSKTNTVTYAKGVGIHSKGEIIVNLYNKGYKKFQAHVGILQNPTKINPNGSIIFKFYLDNKLVKSTNIIYPNTREQFISFYTDKSSKLKIVVDSADNNIDGDWGVLGDAKLIK